MEPKRAKLFMNGRSQAVRLPREFRFENLDEVFIERKGNAVVLTPAEDTWEVFFHKLDQILPEEGGFEVPDDDLGYKELF